MKWRIRRLHFAFSGFYRVIWATKYTEQLVEVPDVLDRGNRNARPAVSNVEGVFEADEYLRAR